MKELFLFQYKIYLFLSDPIRGSCSLFVVVMRYMILEGLYGIFSNDLGKF